MLAPISTAIDGIGKAPIQLKNPTHLRTSIHQPTKIGAYIGPGRPLSEVDLVIVPINDVSTQLVGHGELLHDFYGLIEQNVLDYFKDVTPGTLGDKCSSYKTMLGRDYNFTETDKNFVIGLAAQIAAPSNPSNQLDCIGSEKAALGILNFPYSKSSGAVLTEASIHDHFLGQTGARASITPIQADDYLEDVSSLMNAYVANDDKLFGGSGADAQARFASIVYPGTIGVVDLTSRFWITPPAAEGVSFVDFITRLKDREIQWFGCPFYQPQGSFDAIILAMPREPGIGVGAANAPLHQDPTAPAVASAGNIQSKAGGQGGGDSGKPKYILSELVAIRVAVHAANGAPQISKLEITEQESAIAQAAAANAGQCGLQIPLIDISSLAPSGGQKAQDQSGGQNPPTGPKAAGAAAHGP